MTRNDANKVLDLDIDARQLIGTMGIPSQPLADLSQAFEAHGCVVLRNLFSPERAAELLQICNRVVCKPRHEYERWRCCPLTDNPPVGEDSNYMRHVNHFEYHRDDISGCWTLLDAAAEPVLLNAVASMLDEDFVFSSMSLYFNPIGTSEDGFWHKDQIGSKPLHLWPDSRDTARGRAVHVQVALVPSEDLEVVPGSHSRDFTAVEHEIVRDDIYPNGPSVRSNSMPNAFRPMLRSGDAMAFNSVSIHRGRYHVDKPRRTLMVSFTKRRIAEEKLRTRGLDQYSDQPWFLHPEYLRGVATTTARFFSGAGFMSLYGNLWRQKLVEHMKYRGLMEMLNGEDAVGDQSKSPFHANLHGLFGYAKSKL